MLLDIQLKETRIIQNRKHSKMSFSRLIYSLRFILQQKTDKQIPGNEKKCSYQKYNEENIWIKIEQY